MNTMKNFTSAVTRFIAMFAILLLISVAEW